MLLAKNQEVLHELDLNRYGGIELEDLIQEGRIALLEAAGSFDEMSGTRFSSFAYSVMRNAMNDLCRKGDASFERRLADGGITQVFLNDGPADEDGVPIQEKIPDGSVQDPSGDDAVLLVMIHKLRDRFKKLTKRERWLLSYRYGLRTQEPKTVQEAAAYWHLSEGNARRIERNALRKLRDMMNDGKIE